MADLALRLSIFAPAAIAIGVSCAVLSPVNAQPSNYQDSCGNAFIDGPRLVATCRRVDGSLRRASIMLGGIENINGQLQFTRPNRPASFQDSCQHIHIIGGTITAACRRVDGSYERTSIELPGIENVDGHLRYIGS
jgi:hypothetical protein